MKKVTWKLLAVGAMALNILSMSAEASQVHGSTDLKIMNYNIQGMVFQPIKIDHTRYAKIGKILKQRLQNGTAPDVVLIQEAFHFKTKELMQNAGYPYVKRGPKAGFGRISSGLVILSKYPITFSDKEVYRNCSGIDCFARKGVMVARIQHPQMPFTIDLFNTHMQADYDDRPVATPERAEKSRIKQVDTASQFFVANASSPLSFFAGDFNAEVFKESYNNLLAETKLQSSLDVCDSAPGSCVVHEDPNQLRQRFIDHSFYLNPYGTGVYAMPIDFKRTFTGQDGDYPHLSDHKAVEVTYRIVW